MAKKNSYKEFGNETKIPAAPHNFSNGPPLPYLFINRFRNSIKACFYMFFFSTGTSNFNVSARIRTH